VGTETLVDKSKSTKTVLMSLFAESGNTDMEGATIVNACYGGTAALLNAVAWVESQCRNHHHSSNNTSANKYALVVAADIAAYARGPARPTSGVGAVALLIGGNAPLVVLPDRATHATHVWDFFKPDPAVEYPVVDGASSQACYYQALEDVYVRLADRLSITTSSEKARMFTVETPDYYCFHAPYNKLVQKSFARLYLLDAVRRYRARQEKQQLNDTEATTNGHGTAALSPTDSDGVTMNGHSVLTDSAEADQLLQDWVNKPLEETYADPQLDKVLKQLSAKSFASKLSDANGASQQVGNTYTASIFFGLASLIDRVGRRGELTPGKTIAMFSYGSGALATLYQFQV
jgi:hydroxymethylglutaryl-CoA synthase